MHKSIAVLLITLLLSHPLWAQEISNTMEADRKSFELYEAAQWKKLVRYTRKARKAGFDFHYLRYRQGIAYYELNKFRPSVASFEKVLETNPADETATEYLYYAYLFSGRSEDARILSHSFGEEMKARLGLSDRARLANGVTAEYKYYLFDDFTSTDGRASGTLEQKVRERLNYTTLSLTHLSRKRFSLFHAVSILWGRNRVYDPMRAVNAFDENLRQFQYYIAVNWHLGRGLDLTAGFHYIRTTLEGLNPGYNPGTGMGYQNIRYLFVSKKNAYAGLLKISKSLHNFNFRLSGTMTEMNGDPQYQPSGGMDYYPLGNTTLYISGDAGYLMAPDEKRYSPGLVVKGKIGFRVAGPLWLEPFGQYGRVSNYADDDAYVIYNSNDAIDHWYGVRMNLFFADYRLNIYYLYQHYQYTNFYRIDGVPAETGYRASTHLLGLRWKGW